MKIRILALIVAVLIAWHAPVIAETAPEDLLKAVVKVRAVVPSTARTARILGTEREGNGVVIDASGHILTIGYLVIEAEAVEIIGPGEQKMRATIIGYDHDSGFGLLRANKQLSVMPMGLGQSTGIDTGDPVLVASYGGPEMTQGARVVIRQEFAGSWEYLLEDAIFTAPPHAQFGGAALIGRDGHLIGIGSLLTQIELSGLGTAPCNMFVPIDLLKPILSDLMLTGRSKGPPRPWMGLSSEEVYGRVFVLRITVGGPAEKAGIQPRDIILAVNKKPLTGLADFYRKVWALGSAGVDVPLTVLQKNQTREMRLRSGDRNQFLQRYPVH